LPAGPAAIHTMPMPRSIDLELLDQVYDIPLGKCDWVEVMLRLRRIFNAEVGNLLIYGKCPSDVQALCLCGHEDAALDEYSAYFSAIDPFRKAMHMGLFRSGEVTCDRQVLERKSFERTEFYNDFWRKYRLGCTAGGHHRDALGHWLQLALPRPLDAPDYLDRDLVELRTYFRHIAQAVELQRALAANRGAPDLDALARHYRLTTAETKLVEALIETGSLRQAAARLHRSYNTLRAQLRSILHKTGTKSQVELIRLLHRG